MEAGIFLLLQSFWSYLSNTVAKKSFMSSFEFRFYIICAFGSVALFPILQWIFRHDPIKREIVPQLTFAIEDMNKMTSIMLCSYSTGFIILCADGLTPNKIINQSKFALDVLIANTNISTIYLLVLLISIFHPRPQYSKRSEDSSIHNEKESSKKLDLSQNISSNCSPASFSPQSPTRNMMVDDPYSSQPIMFSMYDPSGAKSQYNSHSPLGSIDKRVASPYQTSINREGTPVALSSQSQNDLKDWLWQSPNRRDIRTS
ncbi:hypothetical protein BY458DRAFT_430158 [Sporodiniella umbellata]|nr:hypothetical protein BY458DRAFT_430158 [Sporodiniella umbellata]